MKNKKRYCANQADPYCHLHKPKQEQSSLEQNSVECECIICYDSNYEYIIHSSCKKIICHDCTIRMGTTKCPNCRGDISEYIPERLKSICYFIRSKDLRIRELEMELASLRVSVESLQISNTLNNLLERLSNLGNTVNQIPSRYVYILPVTGNNKIFL